MGDVHELPSVGRELFLDDEGAALRATWHLRRGLVNLTVWRGNRCTESFQLAIGDVPRLIRHLVDGLATAARPSAHPEMTAGPRVEVTRFVDRLRAAVRQLTA